jgi:site-specific DNA-methyltransferase (adenine-specific)
MPQTIPTTLLTADQSFDFTRRENFLVHGDCLATLEKLPAGCLDLIYVDPPFCTQSKRTRVNGDHHYHDYWPGGLREFLEFLTVRLEHFHRVLKDTGALYVHLDYRSVHYIKVEMDRIFGEQNFLNEIIWSYRTGGISKKWFGRKHQTILSYAKKNGMHKFNPIREGKFRTDGMNYDEEGRPYKTTKKGRLYFNSDGPTLTDVWEIPFLSTVGLERTGYPDQKPLALLERIIKAASDEGDRVADFFAGSGTTAVAARKLNRLFLTVDMNPAAIELIQKRLQDSPDGELELFFGIE